MSKSGVDGTQDHAVDPSEQTETRTRSRVESVDEDWDLNEPVATKVASFSSSPEPSVVERVVNPSKFPSAMAELAKSEPAVLAADDVLVSKTEKRESVAPVAVKSEAVNRAVEKREAAAPEMAKSDEAIAREPVIAIVAAKSESKLEVAKESPSVKLRAARAPQESLLSLEAEYVVDFFSSPPPAVFVDGEGSVEIEYDIAPPPRSLIPAAQLVVRRRYFRRVVLKVMFVALALFGFALYVLWRRGVFATLS
jgi:hypothetical protein